MVMSACPGPVSGSWPLAPPERTEPAGPGHQAASVAVTAAGRSGRDRSCECRGAGDRREAGGGHEEALHSLARHLARVIIDESVQQVPVVGDLVAVNVH